VKKDDARLGRFDLQVRLVLMLLVVFLGVVALMNVFLLGWARDTVDQEVEAGALAAGRELHAAIGALLTDGDETTPGPSLLRRWAGRTGFRSVRVIDPKAGRPLRGAPGSAGPTLLDRLAPDARAGLSAGRAATLSIDDDPSGSVVVFVPAIGADGSLAAILEAVRERPNVASLDRWIGRVRAIQVTGLLIVAAVAVAFANWISRPYRTLAAAAGEAGLTAPDDGRGSEPDQLASAFRAMVDRMREQDRALGSLGGRGGLGDLVRFAQGPAREMTTGVLVLDRRRRIAALNPAAARLLGTAADRARGRALEAVAPTVPGLPRLLAACLEHGRPASREVLPVRWPDGRQAHLGVTLSASPGVDGRPAGALLLMTDLTEIRELQEQARVRENLAAVGEVSAGIAHEIRNALGTILANARMVEKRGDPLAVAPARAIVREVEEVSGVVEEFLTYARPAPPNPTTFELRSVVVRAAAAAPDDVDVRVEGEFGPVHADEGLVARAFDNLLRNASDVAREHGGTVRVDIRGRRVADGRTVQVEVEDDGPGIAEADLERVFAPFYTSRAKGTGLGLAAVRRTLSDLGGSVEAARGADGRGAVFRLRFPVVPDVVGISDPADPGRNET